MSEVARELVKSLQAECYCPDEERMDWIAANCLIEQALLAERAKVWEAAIKVIHHERKLPGLNRVIAITALRAAAEKEVGK